MTDIIDACGQEVAALLDCGYAGQEPQNRDSIPNSGLVIVERVGGGMGGYARSDAPWIQFTVLHSSKKRAWSRIRRVRAHWGKPRSKVGDHFVYGVEEVLNPEDASLPADPFYRVRVSFKFHVKGLA